MHKAAEKMGSASHEEAGLQQRQTLKFLVLLGANLAPGSPTWELLNVEKISMVRQKSRGRIISAESTQICSHEKL